MGSAGRNSIDTNELSGMWLEFEVSLSLGISKSSDNALLVDDAHTLSRDLEGDPHILFGDIEFLGLEVGGKGTLGVDAGVRNVVANNHFLTSNFTNFRHDDIFLDDYCLKLSVFKAVSFQRKRVQKSHFFLK